MPDIFVPTSVTGLAMAKLRRMCSLSEAFQSRIEMFSAESIAEEDRLDNALGHVLYEYVPTTAEFNHEGYIGNAPVMPFASIWPVGFQWLPLSGGVRNFLTPRGQLFLYLATKKNPAYTTWNDTRLEAVDFLDNWLEEIVALSGADDVGDGDPVEDGFGHLLITECDASVLDRIPFEKRNAESDYFFRYVTVTYARGGE